MAYESVASVGVPQDHGLDPRDIGTKNESIGALIERDVNPGVEKAIETIKAKVGDLLQFRITSPQLGRAVLNLQVSVDGNARKVAVVTPFPKKGQPNLDRKDVSVFILAEKPGRASVRITFVDNEGKPFRRTYHLELVER
jgi:hypothetical protein